MCTALLGCRGTACIHVDSGAFRVQGPRGGLQYPPDPYAPNGGAPRGGPHPDVYGPPGGAGGGPPPGAGHRGPHSGAGTHPGAGPHHGAESGGLPADARPSLYVESVPPDASKREISHIFRPFQGFKVRIRCVVVGD